ncbi:hypothetical protein EV702DRAFT_68389 [Suillus placidus]|uniref:Uncharacterized protein n=1 Tax=Suillus placidus TaxID=48579 RepID=A0A9P6ZHA0_9AGAM|nr:hypothetical protein EV702DRAFT_68389 [Suillus placidus]
MRLSFVLAVVAALTVSISAMPSVADTSISASGANTEDDGPVFCLKNSDCFGCTEANLMSSLNLHLGFNHMTHQCDSERRWPNIQFNSILSAGLRTLSRIIHLHDTINAICLFYENQTSYYY